MLSLSLLKDSLCPFEQSSICTKKGLATTSLRARWLTSNNFGNTIIRNLSQILHFVISANLILQYLQHSINQFILFQNSIISFLLKFPILFHLCVEQDSSYIRSMSKRDDPQTTVGVVGGLPYFLSGFIATLILLRGKIRF